MNQMTPIAAGIASLGRGNDSALVHMTPGEVQGLQALAMAHGGSLTINPQTGLPEAGFLSSILPMVAGAALTPIMGPMGAALVVGGLGTVATGSLGKGLMMGLGAYGGAGLGESLSAAGAVGDMGVVQGADIVPSIAQGGGSDAAAMALKTPPNAWTASQQAIDAAMPITEVPGANTWTASQQAIDAGISAGEPVLKQPTSFGGMGQGISNLFSDNEKTREDALKAAGGWKGLATKGGMAAAPMLMAGMQQKPLQTPATKPTTYAKYGYTQERNPLYGQPGQPYFTQRYSSPTFTTDPRQVTMAKAGGLMALADGGYVPESGKVRIPGPGKEGDDSYIPGMDKKRIPGAPDETDNKYEKFTLAQLETLAGRVKNTSDLGEIVTAIQRKKGQSVPGRRVLDTETFMAADGGPVPAPQMPISPLFQQVQTPPPDAMNDYLAQLGQQVMGGVRPSQGIASIAPTVTPTMPASVPDTQAYMYNPTTQTFTANPNYVAPVEDTGGDGGDNGPDFGDAAGGPIKAKYAMGGLSALPEYAAGGRLLSGDGDGVSDSIPAYIKGPKPQRAALADGEFVIPARIVSELGNGSTKAGAKRLYAMMERVQRARRKTTGKNKVAVDTKPDKLLPA